CHALAGEAEPEGGWWCRAVHLGEDVLIRGWPHCPAGWWGFSLCPKTVVHCKPRVGACVNSVATIQQPNRYSYLPACLSNNAQVGAPDTRTRTTTTAGPR